MAHGFNHQDARHYRLFREMSCEERLVAGNILYTYNRLTANAYDFVNQLHGVAVGQDLANTIYVEHGFHRRIIDRSLNLVLAYLLTHRACEPIINCVSGTCSNDASLERFANQSHISDNIQQFMTGTLVLPSKGLMLQVAEFRSVHVRYLQVITETVHYFLLLLQFINNYRIIKVTTLD